MPGDQGPVRGSPLPCHRRHARGRPEHAAVQAGHGSVQSAAPAHHHQSAFYQKWWRRRGWWIKRVGLAIGQQYRDDVPAGDERNVRRSLHFPTLVTALVPVVVAGEIRYDAGEQHHHQNQQD